MIQRFVIILLLLIVPNSVTAYTWYVDENGSGDFTILQDALNAMASGDTIKIGPGRYDDRQSVVGSFPANQWGLYDMHGNMWEWVWCGYYRVYTSSPQVDPVYNVDPGAFRVIRGGSWYDDAQGCRSAYRHSHFPDFAFNNYGFRPVRSAF